MTVADAQAASGAPDTPSTLVTTGYASVNGLEMYYEIHGAGRPLVLLHGALIDGFHPGLLAGIESLQPEHLAGTPWQEEYVRIAPNPENWPSLIAKVKHMDRELPDWPVEAIRSITAPTLIIIGDSDIVRPEHAVEMFRLLGGGVAGDNVGLPNSQLAVLPGTTHVTLVHRADLLLSMIPPFLDAPMPAVK